jgi:hypothetical protein
MMTARKVTRFALVFGMIENLLSIGVVGEKPHPMITAIFGIGLIVAAIISLIGELARLYYIEQIALRIPDAALAKRARLVRWGYGISLGIAGVFGGVLTVLTMTLKKTPQAGWMPLMIGGACITGLAGLVMLGFMIVYLIMLFQLRRALKAQSQFARETWASATAPPSMPPPVVG